MYFKQRKASVKNFQTKMILKQKLYYKIYNGYNE